IGCPDEGAHFAATGEERCLSATTDFRFNARTQDRYPCGLPLTHRAAPIYSNPQGRMMAAMRYLRLSVTPGGRSGSVGQCKDIGARRAPRAAWWYVETRPARKSSASGPNRILAAPQRGAKGRREKWPIRSSFPARWNGPAKTRAFRLKKRPTG